jgi:hypothetical protein
MGRALHGLLNPETPASGVRCHVCRDTGHVCESHPERQWGGLCCDAGAQGPGVCEHGACGCGAPGMPCTACCSPIPEDGRHSIVEAFIPDADRPAALERARQRAGR